MGRSRSGDENKGGVRRSGLSIQASRGGEEASDGHLPDGAPRTPGHGLEKLS